MKFTIHLRFFLTFCIDYLLCECVQFTTAHSINCKAQSNENTNLTKGVTNKFYS